VPHREGKSMGGHLLFNAGIRDQGIRGLRMACLPGREGNHPGHRGVEILVPPYCIPLTSPQRSLPMVLWERQEGGELSA